MSIEQTAAELAEVERDVRALLRRRDELLSRLIDDAAGLVAGLDAHAVRRHEETGERFRVPEWAPERPQTAAEERGGSTALLRSSGALSALSVEVECPEWCARASVHQHYADGQIVERDERPRERSHNQRRARAEYWDGQSRL